VIPSAVFGSIYLFKSWRYSQRTGGRGSLPESQADELKFVGFTTILVALFLVYPQMLKGLFSFFVTMELRLWPATLDQQVSNITLLPGRTIHLASIDLGQVRASEYVSPGADVAGVSPVPVQMWQGRAQSRCRCGRGEPSPGADVAEVSLVPMRMWQGQPQAAAAQMWQGRV
jgi:hypothetical protein